MQAINATPTFAQIKKARCLSAAIEEIFETSKVIEANVPRLADFAPAKLNLPNSCTAFPTAFLNDFITQMMKADELGWNQSRKILEVKCGRDWLGNVGDRTVAKIVIENAFSSSEKRNIEFDPKSIFYNFRIVDASVEGEVNEIDINTGIDDDFVERLFDAEVAKEVAKSLTNMTLAGLTHVPAAFMRRPVKALEAFISAFVEGKQESRDLFIVLTSEIYLADQRTKIGLSNLAREWELRAGERQLRFEARSKLKDVTVYRAVHAYRWRMQHKLTLVDALEKAGISETSYFKALQQFPERFAQFGYIAA